MLCRLYADCMHVSSSIHAHVSVLAYIPHTGVCYAGCMQIYVCQRIIRSNTRMKEDRNAHTYFCTWKWMKIEMHTHTFIHKDEWRSKCTHILSYICVSNSYAHAHTHTHTHTCRSGTTRKTSQTWYLLRGRPKSEFVIQKPLQIYIAYAYKH